MTVVTPSQATACLAATPRQATGTNDDAVPAAASAATDRPFGPDGATILATEHWSLLGTRAMIWNEAMSRTAIFLTVLSASIVALALLADATGFGGRTTAVALVLLPVVFLLGLATYGRLVHLQTWPHFLVTTPTIVATVDAAVASAIVVLVGLAVEAPTAAVVAAGVVGFLAVWGALFSLQRLNLAVLRRSSARFPTPPDEP